MDKRYEKELKISTLFRVVYKHLILFISIFVFTFSIGFAYSVSMNKTTYFADGKIVAASGILGQANYNELREILSSDNFLDGVVDELAYKQISHKNGTSITRSEIEKSIVFPIYVTSNQSRYYTLQFQNQDEFVVVPAFTAYLENAVDFINNNSTVSLPDFSVASAPKKASSFTTDFKSNVIKFAIISIALSYAVCFIYHFIFDYVYDENDIARFGIDSFTFKIRSKKDRKGTPQSSMSDFVNYIEYQKDYKTFSVTNLNRSNITSLFVDNFYKELKSRGEKVTIIDVQKLDNDSYQIVDKVSKQILLSINTTFINEKEFNAFIEELKQKYSKIIICFPSILKSQECTLVNSKTNLLLFTSIGRFTTNEEIYKALLFTQNNVSDLKTVLFSREKFINKLILRKSGIDFDSIEI